MLLTEEEVKYFKENQDRITIELLEALRAQGNDGKFQALEILDIPKNEKMYYLDAFGEQISYDGNKGLKKPGTVLKLAKIHEIEIQRCAEDFNYFRENYIQIRTPTGINFPDIRPYQTRLIDVLLLDDKEDVVGLMGRQCIEGSSMLDMQDRNRTIRELFENPEL